MLKKLKNLIFKSWQDQRIRKDVLSFTEFGFGYLAVLLAGLFLARYINQHLTVEDMGKYSFVVSWVMILSPFLYFSAPQAYLRFHDQHNISRNLRKFLLPFFWFSAAALAGVIYYFTRSWIAMLYAFMPLMTEKTYLLRSQMRITSLNFLQITNQLIPLALLLFCCKKYDLNAGIVLGFHGIAYLLPALFPAGKLSSAPIDKRQILHFLWPSIFTVLLTMILTNSAVLFAKYFFGYENAWILVVAIKAMTTASCMFTFFLMFFPVIYIREAQAGNLKLIRLYRGFITITALAGCLVFMIFHKFIYFLLGAEKYYDHAYLFVILVAVAFFNFIADIYWLYFSFEIKTWKNALLKGASCLILAIGIGFTPHFGISYIAWLLLAATAIPAVSGMIMALIAENKNLKKKV